MSDHKLQDYAYNPQFFSDEDLEKIFIIRQDELRSILSDITTTPKDAAPGHHLVIGQRGMGKSTLLRKLAAELRKPKWNKQFIPVSFAEEQYVEVRNLSEFWLNCLDSLADALEYEKNNIEAEKIDALILEIKNLDEDSEELEFTIRMKFENLIEQMDRRLVLLIDNFGPLMKKIGADEDDYVFRSFITKNDSPVIVSASLTQPRDSKDHSKALYEAFKPKVLKPLSVEEIKKILISLAEIRGDKDVIKKVHEETSKLYVLKDLSGGNPRTIHYIYSILKQGFSKNIIDDLKHLVDSMTALYQSYFDQLTELQADIISCLARNQRPLTASEVTEQKELNRSSVSPQLNRLEDIGMIESVSLFNTKKTGYQIAERFFNLWYIFRYFSRRERVYLSWVTQFLQDFYMQEELCDVSSELLKSRGIPQNETEFALVLSGAVQDQDLSSRLRAKAELSILHVTEGIKEKIEALIGTSANISSNSYSLNELRQKLIKQTPKERNDRAEEYADLVLGSWSVFTYTKHDLREKIANSSISLYQWDGLVKVYLEEHGELVEKGIISLNDLEWLQEQLKLGIIFSPNDSTKLQRMVEHRPNLLLINHCIKKGLLDDAEIACDKMLEVHPNNADTWSELGDTLKIQLNKYEKAKLAYEKAIISNPRDANAWRCLGNILQFDLNECQEAQNAYEKSIEFDPDSSATWAVMANLLHYRLSMYEESRRAYEKAIEVNSEYAYAWRGLANLLQYHFNEYEESEKAYTKSIELEPKNVRAWNGLGNLLRDHLHKYADAVAAYNTALEANPKDANAWNSLGNLYADYLNQPDKALKSYQEALELPQENSMVIHNLIFLERDIRNNNEEALKLFNTLKPEADILDTYELQRFAFALYDDNWGAAKSHLSAALKAVERKLPPHTRDDWFRVIAVAISLGFTDKLLDYLYEIKADVELQPLVEAIKAHQAGSIEYTRNIAKEIRPVTQSIYTEIAKRIANYQQQPD